jgi:hypothetical protein
MGCTVTSHSTRVRQLMSHVPCPTSPPPHAHISPLHFASLRNRFQDWPHALCLLSVLHIGDCGLVYATEQQNKYSPIKKYSVQLCFLHYHMHKPLILCIQLKIIILECVLSTVCRQHAILTSLLPGPSQDKWCGLYLQNT